MLGCDEYVCRNTFAILLLTMSAILACPRDQSRVVRRRMLKVMQPIYDDYNTLMSPQCPLHANRDRYSKQEGYKTEESPQRWHCEYCGKSFYAEPFIDMHMDNKHPDKIKTDEWSVCLADYCDIFRCEVLTSGGGFTFWKQALCKEKHMKTLKLKCQNLMRICMPEGIEHKHLQDSLEDSVCSYLTCENYSDKSDTEQSTAPTVLYTVSAIFQIFFCVIYYVIAYTHFYDEPLLDSNHVYEQDEDTDLTRKPDADKHSAQNPPTSGSNFGFQQSGFGFNPGSSTQPDFRFGTGSQPSFQSGSGFSGLHSRSSLNSDSPLHSAFKGAQKRSFPS